MLFTRLLTSSSLPSGVTAMPCDGSAPSGTSFLPGRQRRIRNALDFLVRSKIDHRETVKIAQLNEQVLGGPVGIGRHGHRTDASVHLNDPGDFVGRRVHHVHRFCRNGAGDNVFAVRRNVRVVDGALRTDGLDVRQRSRVNHIEAAGRLRDGDVDRASIRSDGDVVGMPAQRDSLDHLPASWRLPRPACCPLRR